GRVHAPTDASDRGAVILDTGFGERRLLERDGEPLPRIC
ncbi:MAG: hydrogenase expression/formation protein HypE, partial [Myxococcales bacterium]|nr:hydrogenase expression/formation protein HypE [Myxococcales bacterium]